MKQLIRTTDPWALCIPTELNQNLRFLDDSFFFFQFILLKYSIFYFGHVLQQWGILVPLPGIEPMSPALKAQSLNHWTTRLVPIEVQLICSVVLISTVQLLLLLSHFSHVRLCATPQTAAHQAPLFLRFSRKEYWSELPLPSPA